MNNEGAAISISADEMMRWEARIGELNATIINAQVERDLLHRRLEAAKYLVGVIRPSNQPGSGNA